MPDKYLTVTKLYSLPNVLNDDITSTTLIMLEYFDGSLEISGTFDVTVAISAGDTILDLSSDSLLGSTSLTFATAPIVFVQNDGGTWTTIAGVFAGITNPNKVVVEESLALNATVYISGRVFRTDVRDQPINIVGARA